MTAPAKPSRKPEAKAVAATGAAGFSGGAAILFVLWLLGTQVWDAPSDAVHANAAIAAVPFPVNALVGAGVTALLTYAAAYLAPHTHRPDLVDETQPVIQPVAIPDDETKAHLENIDTTLGQMQADLHHTEPIPQPPDLGLAILGDEAHD